MTSNLKHSRRATWAYLTLAAMHAVEHYAVWRDPAALVVVVAHLVLAAVNWPER